MKDFLYHMYIFSLSYSSIAAILSQTSSKVGNCDSISNKNCQTHEMKLGEASAISEFERVHHNFCSAKSIPTFYDPETGHELLFDRLLRPLLESSIPPLINMSSIMIYANMAHILLSLREVTKVATTLVKPWQLSKESSPLRLPMLLIQSS